MLDSFPKPEAVSSPEQQLEHIPTAEEVREVFKRLTKKDCKETLNTEDELGLYILRVETPGSNPGDIDEYEYRRKKKYTEDDKSKTEICIVYYSDGMPCAGQNVAEYINGKWEISLGIYPGVSMEDIQTRSFAEINHDISSATPEQRKVLFERLAIEKDENWACEALEIKQSFSLLEEELMISIITDPFLSFRVLTMDMVNGSKLTQAHTNYLMTQLESDKDVAESFYLQLVESGVAEDPNETEQWWLERLQKLLS